MEDFYKILGISPNAEDVVIRAAYKALAQKYHPHKWRHSPKVAEERMSEINRAYHTLSDIARKSRYDEINNLDGSNDIQRSEIAPQTKSEVTVFRKQTNAWHYVYIPILILFVSYIFYGSATKNSLLNSPVKEYAGIKDSELMGIHMSSTSIMESVELPLKTQSDLSLKHIVYESKLDAVNRKSKNFNSIIKKQEIIHEVLYESTRSGLDAALSFALIDEISNFNQMHRDPQNGSIGLMGVKSIFAETYTHIDPDYLFLIKINLRYGLSIFRAILDKNKGDITLSLEQYYDINLYSPKNVDLVSKSRFIENVIKKYRYWSE